MSFALIIVGVVMLVSAIRGTQQQLVTLLKGDLTGPNNFVYWMLAILAIGALGYVPKLKPLSSVLLALVIAVLFFKGKGATGAGFFSQLFSQVSSATSQSQSSNAVATIAGAPAGSSPAGSLLSGLSGAGQALGQLPTLPTLTSA